jgi:hypothetical protein
MFPCRRRPSAWLFGAAVGVALCGAPARALSPASDVVVVKRAGVTAYEEVTEEFGEHCRVHARVISFGDEGLRGAAQMVRPEEVVVTIGQEALDFLRASSARLIPTLAFHMPPGLVGPPAAPPPELILRVLSTARPKVKVVGTIYGPRSDAAIHAAFLAAERLGLVLIASRVPDGPAAVRALRTLVTPSMRGDVRASRIDALWLPGDTDVITPQVFQFALQVQLERGLPVAAATRQQVHSGALLAVDFDPREAGRTAADLTNRLLEGQSLEAALERVDLTRGARLTVNGQVARRLGVDGRALAQLGARLE